MIIRTCNECGHEESFSAKEPTNFACQKCGSPYVRFNKSLKLICSACQLNREVRHGDVFFSCCSGCGVTIHLVDGITIGQEESIKQLTTPDVGPDLLKVVIPYYDGGAAIERAVRTWILPEVVFALTDEGVIPPGTGVCGQFFTHMNCNDILASREKAKLPLFKDILELLMLMYPDQKYYGYFNSDIILPPGKSIYDLLPSDGKSVVMHHRLEVVGSGDTIARDLKPHHVVVVGKDGFIFSREAAEDIVENFGGDKDFIIGRPFWDTALAIYLWEKYGWDKIDFAYREVWHVAHKSVTQATLDDYNSSGGKWNHALGDKIFKKDHQGNIWKDVCNETLDTRSEIRRKKVGIIQPGRIGDILIVLPIAKWYYDKGYEVIWPVTKEFIEIFDRINYVHVVQVEGATYIESKKALKKYEVDFTIDLAIGFGSDEASWKNSGLSFDEWKYKEAEVPFSEKYNLQFERDLEKEQALIKKLNLGRFEDGYVLTQSRSSFAKYDFNIPDSIEVMDIAGFHFPFDWITALENARYYFGVDSCITNLVDQLDLCRGQRYFKNWSGVRAGKDLEIRTPKLSTWETHCPVIYEGNEYPEYINDNDAISHTINKASKYCKGKGIDLGGGEKPFPGAENFDIINGADINQILHKGFPYKNLDYIFSSHFLEHVLDYEAVLEECYKALKPDGILFLYLPHPDNEYWHPSNPAMGGELGHKHILYPDILLQDVEKCGFKLEESTVLPDHYYSYYGAARKEESYKIVKPGKVKKAKAKKDVKISFVTIVYNGMPFIEPCIEMMKQYSDEVIVVEGPVKSLYESIPENVKVDGTRNYLLKLFKRKEIEFSFNSIWQDKMAMQNEALKHVTGDYVWLVDSDEFYLNSSFKKVIGMLRKDEPDQVNFPIHNFFKSLRYVMSSRGDKFMNLTADVPRVFRMQKNMRFLSHWPPTTTIAIDRGKLIRGFRTEQRGIYIYHLGYMDDAQVKQKCKLYEKTHPDHKDIADWYNDFWCKWKVKDRKKLEGSPFGVWFPDSTSRTIEFRKPIPKVLQLIYPNARGVTWAR